MSSVTGGSTGLRSSLTGTTPTFRPWRDFFDPSAISIPASLSDATTRLFQNLTHFRPNYAAIFLVVLFLRLVSHPIAAIAILAVAALWAFLFLFAPRDGDESITVFGFSLSNGVVMGGLGVVSLVVVLWSGVFWNVVVSLAIWGVLMGSHAVLRSTDDLVSDEVGPGDSQGTYSIL